MRLPINYLFNNHQHTIKLYEEVQAYNNRGILENTKQNIRMIDAIVRPLSPDNSIYDENGVYTNNDIKVFTKDPLQIKKTKIEYNGDVYTVMEGQDNKFHGDYYSYIAKCEGVT